MTPRRLLVAAPLVIGALALSACGSGNSGGSSTGQVAVVASFYPLQFATQQIGGVHVATVSKARLVVYQKGLQGAVDKAVGAQGGNRGLDVAPAANLNLLFQPAVGAPAPTSGANAPGTTDPHFWLDPKRYADVAKLITQRLSRLDPANKLDYAKNAKVFEDKLATLNAQFTTGLANCQRKDIITSHFAFGYLAQRFALKQVAINGLSPDQEPKAADLAAVSSYARAHGVTTIYAETLVSPAIAQTVANEAGAKMATLDPIEGLTDKSPGKGYFEVMRSNLKALQAGQGCS